MNGLDSTIINALVFGPEATSTLYAGTTGPSVGTGRVYRSVDGGGSWTTLAGMGVSSVSALAVDPAAPTTIYAAAWGERVYKSTDGGKTWSSFNISGIQYMIEALAVDPKSSNILYAGAIHDTRTSFIRGGVFKSIDGGGEWAEKIPGFLHPPQVRILAIDPSNPATLYAVTDDGVYRSTDGADQWEFIFSDPGAWYVTSLAIDSGHPGAVYLSTNYGGISVLD